MHGYKTGYGAGKFGGYSRLIGGGGVVWGDCQNTGLATYTPASGSASNQEGYRFTVGADDIRMCSFRHHWGGSVPGSVTLRLWRTSDQILLASKVFTPTQGASWEEIPLDEPMVLEAGETYVVTGRSTNGANVTRFYTFEPVTVHPAITYKDAVTIASNNYPTSGNSWFRLVDIVFALET